MSRLSDWSRVIHDPGATLQGSHADDDLLFDLLVHISFADGIVSEEEFDLLHRLCPDEGYGELLVRVSSTAEQPFDTHRLSQAYPSTTDRRAIVALADHLAAADGDIPTSEQEVLAALRATLLV